MDKKIVILLLLILAVAFVFFIGILGSGIFRNLLCSKIGGIWCYWP